MERKLQWLMQQPIPAKAVIGFINDCLGWQRKYGLPAGAERRALRFIDQIEAGEITLSILEEVAAPVITHLAYIREGAHHRQMESPDEPVRNTADWWVDRTPGWAFA